MKKLAILALAAVAAPAVLAGPNVGVSVHVNQPGVYGRVDIGNYGPPPLVQPQPVIITRPAVVVEQPPLYLYVPPGHQKNWRRHCGQYNACGRPVYFVQERWVRERWEQEHRGPRHAGHGAAHGHGEWHDDRHDAGEGPGHGHGH
ncbi:MAG: hypothetical protein ACJ8G7_23140 [Rhizobacter sp.]